MGRRATVFGLDVSANVELPFLSGDAAEPTGRAVRITLTAPGAQGPAWPAAADLVCDQRERDGSVCFRIEAGGDAGFLIWGPRYGRHFVSGDGSAAISVLDGCDAAAWQRMLIAQVLPFVAALHGLEVFHASAVASAAGAIALVGPSGAGKTSLAIELCRAGARFLADDVLVLERCGESLLVHPGTPIVGVAATDAGDSRKRLVRVRGGGSPARLAAMFFLERGARASLEPCFEPLADARALLSATFNSVLTDGERLHRLLDVCALAARCRIERVLVSGDAPSTQLASALARRLAVAA